MHDSVMASPDTNFPFNAPQPVWPFLDLPQDLFEEILRHLDCVSLLHCSMACRSLYKLVMTNSEFCYTLELGKQALIDTSANDISYARRLEGLRAQRRAWSTLNWRNQFELKTNMNLDAYEMVDGHFACIDHAGNFQVVRLPSGEDDTSPIVFNAQLGINPQDFTIDPAQDLVVFFVPKQGPLSRTEGRDVYIHLWTLSSYKPHPSAQTPLLSFFIPPDDMWANEVQMSSVQLVDDILAIFYSTGSGWLSPRLLLWNWKLGILLTDSHRFGLPRHTMGFSLISSNAFALTCIENNGSVELFTFSRVALVPPTHIVKLELPQKSSKAELGLISIHSGPLSSSSNAYPRPDTAVLVISPQYIAGVRFALYPFSIYVLNRTLLSFISQHQSGSLASRFLTWEEWSLDSTRIVPDLTRNTWLRYVHGQRIVFPPFGGGFSTQTLRILDFNVDCFGEHVTAPFLPSSSPDNSSVHRTSPTRTLHSHKSVISDDTVFRQRVQSKLPCVSVDTQIRSSVKFETFLIDQSHIVGMRLRKETGELHLQIFCF